MNACPDRGQFLEYLDGRLPRDDESVLEAHVEGCQDCQRRLKNLAEETPLLPPPLSSAPSYSMLLRMLCRMNPPGRNRPDHDGRHSLPVVEVPGFEIERELGRGGAGVVYLAREIALDRRVAIKVILPIWATDPEYLARFRAEAQLAASVQHPNLVEIFRIGEHQGLPYCVMEYVEGGNLREKAIGQRIRPREAAALVAELALGIAAMHAAGLVHRDLKPENILIGRDGTPKVTDFGLVRQLGGQRLTRSGQVLGTPCYMAPEQATGRSLQSGNAVDVYGLGVLLYEMLTGCPPFAGVTDDQILAQILEREPVSPSSLTMAVPEDLEAICLRCLQKEPTRRYASAIALKDDLDRFLIGRPPLVGPISRGERLWWLMRRRPTATAALFLLATLAIGGPLVAVRQARLVKVLAGRNLELDLALAGEREERSLAEIASGSTIFASGLSSPVDLAFDAEGNLYVSNQASGTVTKVTTGGLANTFARRLNQPFALAFDRSGFLYVSEMGTNTVSKVSPGGVVSTFAGGFFGPAGLTFDPAGNLYVSNTTAGRIDQVSPDGAIRTYVANSSFDHIQMLKFDLAGNLYVSNTSGATVCRVTPRGAVDNFASNFNTPGGLAFDASGNLFVSNQGSNTVRKITPAGTNSLFGHYLNPHGLAFDSVGNLYIVDRGANTVTKVSEATLSQWGHH